MPTNREIIQRRGKQMGRCPCSMPNHPFPCPCKFFIDKDLCHCAQEAHPGFSQEEWLAYNLDEVLPEEGRSDSPDKT